MKGSSFFGRRAVWAAFGVLFLLHHDFWNWADRTLLGGWLPIGLAWHVGFSLAAALLWAAAVRWAWPEEVEQWAETPHTDKPSAS